jgi:GMP synthase (glutamine-hydrolysing)
MTSEPRLMTEIWVQACIRRANAQGIPVTVVYKGDPARGSVLVKLMKFEMGCIVLAETRDDAGGRAWMRGTGPAPVEEATADAYIARNRKYDPDLWVIEIEDREGRLPFDETVLGI